MLYLMILILLAAVGFTLWRIQQSPNSAATPRAPRREVPRGPDDDPDFLRNL